MISSVREENVASINSIGKESSVYDNPDFESEINLPREYKDKILKLINKSKDPFASKDTDLGHTDTVKIKIDTGNNTLLSIKLLRLH